jgi:hypothetical protein
MLWDITMLLVHLLVLGALASLCRHSPGFLQWVVLGLLIAAELLFVWVYAAKIAGAPLHWLATLIAHRVAHVATIVYVLRLFVVDQERRCLPNSSARSPSSPR